MNILKRSICQFDHIYKKFGNQTVLNDITFEIQRGEFSSLIGPNGAGKTTIIKLLLGCLRYTKGIIFLFGEEINRTSLKRIGFCPERLEFPNVSIQTFLSYIGSLKGLSYSETNKKINSLLTDFDLKNKIKSPINTLSAGMKQKVRIMQTFLNDPEFLILDEPTVNLDIFSREMLLKRIREYCSEREATVLLSTHILSDLGNKDDYLLLLNNGSLIFTGQAMNLYSETQNIDYILETSNAKRAYEVLSKSNQFTVFYTPNTNSIGIKIKNDTSPPHLVLKNLFNVLFNEKISIFHFSSHNELKAAVLNKFIIE
ncbi:MAG: ABC transporter ATP-binding protein [Candidatus Hermodarchaeota archaeon]